MDITKRYNSDNFKDFDWKKNFGFDRDQCKGKKVFICKPDWTMGTIECALASGEIKVVSAFGGNRFKEKFPRHVCTMEHLLDEMARRKKPISDSLKF